jgi:hypothetical protein
MLSYLDISFRRRHQVFEFGDQPWLPSIFRDGIRGFLDCTHRVMGYYKPWASILAEVLRTTGQREIVVLGGGGLVFCQLLQDELRKRHQLDVKIYLTDLYPVPGLASKLRAGDNIVVVQESINMLKVPPSLKGVRLIVNAFHHLSPEQAVAVLEDAHQQNSAICICEYTRNSLVGVISSFLYPFFNWLIAPGVSQARLSTLFFTYIVPVFPLMLAIDGLMSNCRSYSTYEFKAFTSKFKTNSYQWSWRENHTLLHPTVLTTFIGLPPVSEFKERGHSATA